MQIFNQCDDNGNGELNFNEFLMIVLDEIVLLAYENLIIQECRVTTALSLPQDSWLSGDHNPVASVEVFSSMVTRKADFQGQLCWTHIAIVFRTVIVLRGRFGMKDA